MGRFPSNPGASFGHKLQLADNDHQAARLALIEADWLLDTPDATHAVTITGLPVYTFLLPEHIVQPLGPHWDTMSVSVTQPPVDAVSKLPICEVLMRASDSWSRFARIAPHPGSPGQYLAFTGDKNHTSPVRKTGITLDPEDVLDVVRCGFDLERWNSLSLTEPVTPTQGIVDTVLELRSEPTSTAEVTSDQLTGAYVTGDNIVSTQLTRVENTRRDYPSIHRYNLQTITHTPYSNPGGEVVADITRTLTYSVQDSSGVHVVPPKAHLAVVFEATGQAEPTIDYSRLYNQARVSTQITALEEVREALDALASSYGML